MATVNGLLVVLISPKGQLFHIQALLTRPRTWQTSLLVTPTTLKSTSERPNLYSCHIYVQILRNMYEKYPRLSLSIYSEVRNASAYFTTSCSYLWSAHHIFMHPTLDISSVILDILCVYQIYIESSLNIICCHFTYFMLSLSIYAVGSTYISSYFVYISTTLCWFRGRITGNSTNNTDHKAGD